MDTGITVALIVAIPAFLSPLILAWLTNRNLRFAKAQDYKRQDDVAAQAASAARLLLAANERVAASTRITNGKLDVIHALVNSNMTAVIGAELAARRENLVLLLEVVAIKRAAGHEPTDEAISTIEVAKSKIAELETTLADRLKGERT